MRNKIVRPTVRFSEPQYELIKMRLEERDVTFQQYCLELICKDLGVPVEVFEPTSGQLSMFDDQE